MKITAISEFLSSINLFLVPISSIMMIWVAYITNKWNQMRLEQTEILYNSKSKIRILEHKIEELEKLIKGKS